MRLDITNTRLQRMETNEKTERNWKETRDWRKERLENPKDKREENVSNED